MKEHKHEVYLRRTKKETGPGAPMRRRKVDLAAPAEFMSLTSNSTQVTASDDEKETALEPYVFSDVEPDENLGDLKLVPSVDDQVLCEVREQAKHGKDRMKSPAIEYTYAEEEDSLYNVPSIQWDPSTQRHGANSSSSMRLIRRPPAVVANSARSHYIFPDAGKDFESDQEK